MASAEASRHVARDTSRHAHKPLRRFEREDLAHGRAIEWQVHSGADADLQHPALCRANHTLAKRQELLVAHRETAKPWQDDVVVEAHRALRRFFRPP
jgi:hypothetical protein